MEKLVAACDGIDDTLILVGSSMGGHVATAAAERVNAAGLFVLAPAYYVEGYEELTPPPPDLPICIVHGWHDDVARYRDKSLGRAIGTPSYRNVTDAVYSRSVGRWRAYRRQLSPVLDPLKPFAASFGYPED